MEQCLPILNENNFEPRILYLTKLSIKCEDKIQAFSDTQRLRMLAFQAYFLRNSLRNYKFLHQNMEDVSHKLIQSLLQILFVGSQLHTDFLYSPVYFWAWEPENYLFETPLLAGF